MMKLEDVRMTKSELAFWDDLANIVGCIACRKDGIINHYVSIHHIDGRTKKGAHMNVLPLCAAHHQTGGEEAPSVHPFKRRFEDKYGKQADLLKECMSIIDEAKEEPPRLEF